jgi:hypothetical protein
MIKQKNAMVTRYPTKYTRMEWGQHLQDFKVVRDFVRNTPWRNREETSTIQAFHKIAWHLKRPSSEVDQFYTILRVMKNNKSIFRLLGAALMLTRNPGPDALPILWMRLAGLVHFHTSSQMSINHVALRGLVNLDKEVVISQLDGEGDPKDQTVHPLWNLARFRQGKGPGVGQGQTQGND